MNTLSKFIQLMAMLPLYGVVHAAALDSAPLGPDGLGALRIGMSLAQINAHLEHKIQAADVAARATPNCDYSPLADLPGVSLVFIDDKLARIDIETGRIAATGGLTVGTTQTTTLKHLPHAKFEPLDHVPNGASYVVERPRAANALSFRFEQGKLARILAGRRKVIRYAEGCMWV